MPPSWHVPGPLATMALRRSTSEDISTKLNLTEITLELIKTEPSVFDAGDAKPLELREGTVKFEGVSFTYSTQKEKALKDITFIASQGTTTAIVGITGGGETTMMKLLQRLYDPECGTISVDNQDIRHITIERYAKSRMGEEKGLLTIQASMKLLASFLKTYC
jgi:ABC-type multidrug transport system fused ATPase/permease subunit